MRCGKPAKSKFYKLATLHLVNFLHGSQHFRKPTHSPIKVVWRLYGASLRMAPRMAPWRHGARRMAPWRRMAPSPRMAPGLILQWNSIDSLDRMAPDVWRRMAPYGASGLYGAGMAPEPHLWRQEPYNTVVRPTT